ncbi:MAG: caspase family protein [Planctomycetota bacterium]
MNPPPRDGVQLVLQLGAFLPHDACVDPSGRLLALQAGRFLQVWSLTDRVCLHSTDLGALVQNLQWPTADGPIVVYDSGRPFEHDWWTGETRAVRPPADAGGKVRAEDVALARFGRDGVVRLRWDASGHQLQWNGGALIEGLPEDACSLHSDPVGRVFLVGCAPDRVLVFDAATRSKRCEIRVPCELQRLTDIEVVFTPDADRVLMTIGWQKQTVLLRLQGEGSAVTPTVPEGTEWRRALGFDKTGARLLVDLGRLWPVWFDTSSGKVLGGVPDQATDMRTFCGYATELDLLCCHAGSDIHLFSGIANDSVRHLGGSHSAMRSILAHRAVAAEPRLAIAYSGATIVDREHAILDLATGLLSRSEPPPEPRTASLVRSGEGLEACGVDGVVRAIDGLPGASDHEQVGWFPNGAVLVGANEVHVVDLELAKRILHWSSAGGPAPARVYRTTNHWLVERADGGIELRIASDGAKVLEQKAGFLGEFVMPGSLDVYELEDGLLLATGAEWIRLRPGSATPVSRAPRTLRMFRRLEGGRWATWGPTGLLVCKGDPVGESPEIVGKFEAKRLGAADEPLFLPHLGLLVTQTGAGGLTLWSLERHEVLAEVYVSLDHGVLWLRPDGSYLATSEALSLLAARRGTQLLPTLVFDRECNDPATVLAAIGHTPDALLQHLRAARQRRLAQPVVGVAELGTETALELAWQQLPPIEADALVSLQLRTAAGPAKLRLHVLRNGVPLASRDGFEVAVAADGSVQHDVPLGPGENRLVAWLARDDGGRSPVVTATVSNIASPRAGRIFYLGLGVANHPEPRWRLQGPARDVAAFAEALRDLYGERALSKTLVDEQVTRTAIRAAREHLLQAGADDTVLVHLAGHGFLADGGRYHFLSHDGEPARPDTCLSFDDLEGLLEGLSAGSKLVLLDTCHSGPVDRASTVATGSAASGSARGVDPEPASDAGFRWAFADLNVGSGATILAAAGAQRAAYESRDQGLGWFTAAAIECLRQALGADADGVLRVQGFAKAVRQRVLASSQGAQEPVVRAAPIGFDTVLFAGWPSETFALPGGVAGVDQVASSADGDDLLLATDRGLFARSLTAGSEWRSIPEPPGRGARAFLAFRCLGPDEHLVATDERLWHWRGGSWREHACPGGLTMLELAQERRIVLVASPQHAFLLHLENGKVVELFDRPWQAAASSAGFHCLTIAGTLVDIDFEGLARPAPTTPGGTGTVVQWSRGADYMLTSDSSVDGPRTFQLRRMADGSAVGRIEVGPDQAFVVHTEGGPIEVQGGGLPLGRSPVVVFNATGQRIAERMVPMLSGSPLAVGQGTRFGRCVLSAQSDDGMPRFDFAEPRTLAEVIEPNSGRRVGWIVVRGRGGVYVAAGSRAVVHVNCPGQVSVFAVPEHWR